jgi:hypothetical protein
MAFALVIDIVTRSLVELFPLLTLRPLTLPHYFFSLG